jgi:hypothetical protein
MRTGFAFFRIYTNVVGATPLGFAGLLISISILFFSERIIVTT